MHQVRWRWTKVLDQKLFTGRIKLGKTLIGVVVVRALKCTASLLRVLCLSITHLSRCHCYSRADVGRSVHVTSLWVSA